MALPAWIIVAALLIVVLIILFRTMNQVYILSLVKKNFFWFFAVAFLVFLAISLVHIHSNYDIDLATYEGVSAAGKIYLSWAGNVINNLAKVTGYIIQQDWTSTGNSTG